MDFICMHNDDDDDCVPTNRSLGKLRALTDDAGILCGGCVKACTELVRGRWLNIENGPSHVRTQTTTFLELILIVTSFLK
jgi:hypothetical protein